MRLRQRQTAQEIKRERKRDSFDESAPRDENSPGVCFSGGPSPTPLPLQARVLSFPPLPVRRWFYWSADATPSESYAPARYSRGRRASKRDRDRERERAVRRRGLADLRPTSFVSVSRAARITEHAGIYASSMMALVSDLLQALRDGAHHPWPRELRRDISKLQSRKFFVAFLWPGVDRERDHFHECISGLAQVKVILLHW